MQPWNEKEFAVKIFLRISTFIWSHGMDSQYSLDALRRAQIFMLTKDVLSKYVWFFLSNRKRHYNL